MEVFVEVSNYSIHYHRNSTIQLQLGFQLRSRLDLLHPDLSGHVEERQWKQKQVHDKQKHLGNSRK